MTVLTAPGVPVRAAPQLHSGDRMTREEFLRSYEQTPEDFRAELVGGVVYVASPLREPHADADGLVGGLFFHYAARTAGVRHGHNATILLGQDGVPQPDLYLRILPEYGGQSRTSRDGYIEGPPELIAEISHSSRAIDLHAKRADYARYGVLEYLVFCLEEPRLRWFDLRADRELQAGADGISRMNAFAGLWIDGPGLLAGDHTRLLDTLNRGLTTPEHAAFVERLAAARRAAQG